MRFKIESRFACGSYRTLKSAREGAAQVRYAAGLGEEMFNLPPALVEREIDARHRPQLVGQKSQPPMSRAGTARGIVVARVGVRELEVAGKRPRRSSSVVSATAGQRTCGMAV